MGSGSLCCFSWEVGKGSGVDETDMKRFMVSTSTPVLRAG